MICEHCGTEYPPIAYNYGAMHTDQACRDVLKAQLASMTKRAEEAEAKLIAVLIGAGAFRERIVEIADDLLGLQPADAPTLSLLDDIDRRAHEERIRAAAAEAKLAALREVGITIDDVQAFVAFTPEAKAAYPEKPQYLIRTKGMELRHTEAEVKLAMAVEALKDADEGLMSARQSFDACAAYIPQSSERAFAISAGERAKVHITKIRDTLRERLTPSPPLVRSKRSDAIEQGKS